MVLPEYLNKKGQFKGEGEIKLEDVEKILTEAGEKLSELLPYSFLVNKFTLRVEFANSTIPIEFVRR